MRRLLCWIGFHRWVMVPVDAPEWRQKCCDCKRVRTLRMF